jgi:Leucine-rich repeat (LRR) protein
MLVVPVAHSWQRFLRFSVRGLIVLVLVTGVSLGWLVRIARNQRDAVAAIEKARGMVFYNWAWSNGKSVAGTQPWTPRWLVDLIGVDFFGHVTAAGLSRTETDATLVQVSRLSQLEELFLNQSSVTDAGLQHLDGLTDLTRLYVGDTQVSDAGLAHLKRLTKLSELRLHRTQVTDSGLMHLKGLTKLTKLYLAQTQVSDAGLAHLKGLTKLSELRLHRTQVTDAGVNKLQRALPNLKIIR